MNLFFLKKIVFGFSKCKTIFDINEPVYITIVKDIRMMMSCVETDYGEYKTSCHYDQ